MRKSSTPETTRPAIDLEAVRAFAVVARTGSITEAARQLRVTPGAVSRRIQALEERLKATLFERGPSGVTLTEAGLVALERANAIHALAEDFERSLAAHDLRLEGNVSVSLPDLLAAYIVAPKLPEFLQQNPGINLMLDCGMWRRSLVRDDHDIMLAFDEGQRKPDDEWIKVATMHHVLAASQRFIDRYGLPKSVEDLGRFRRIRHIGTANQQATWTAAAHQVRAMTGVRLMTNSGAVALKAVLDDVGLTAAPSYLIRFTDLVPFDLPPIAANNIWLVYNRQTKKIARVAKVIALLQQIFDPADNPWFRADFVPPDRFEAELAAKARPNQASEAAHAFRRDMDGAPARPRAAQRRARPKRA